MKRTLISMIFCVPMLALASEQDCSPAVRATAPAAATELAPVTDLALDAEATAATQAPEAVEATAATLGGVATPLPCVAVAPAPVAEPAYVPKTEHDNSPWRFDMNQNGRRMTADEFDAWMKARGVRVARGSAPAAAPAAPAGTEGQPAPAEGTPVPATDDGEPR